MCGFVAVFNRNGSPVDERMLRDAIQSLHHRGPDEADVWIGGPSRNVGIAHTRLSIIDLTGGRQPLRSERAIAVVNGEFYDYQRIRRELASDGYSFQTQSDSEILLPLFEKYDIHCMRHLRGEFAFALYAQQEQSLILARDRFGIKPLYYYEDEHRIIAASEIKALLALGVSPEWNREVVHQFLSRFVCDPTATFFNKVRQVPPAHTLVATQRGIRIEPYWDLDFSENVPSTLTFEDAALEFKSRFEEAVRLRLVADVPVGVYLSGGLDSSSVFGTAARIANQVPKAFTIKFQDSQYDESEVALETARAFGADIQVLEVSESDLLDQFESALWHSEHCFTNTHGIAKFLLSGLVNRAGHKVVLTGEGSDEILGGYAHFRLDYLREHQKDSELFADSLNALSSANPISQGLILSHSSVTSPILESILGMTPEFLRAPDGSFDRVDALFSNEFLASAGRRDPYRDLMRRLDLRPLRRADHMHRSMYVWAKTVFPSYMLNVLGDRMEMAHSVEARVPFLDHKLVEFVQGIPSRWKFNNAQDKLILRKSMQDVLTPTVFRREKHPFLAPPASMNTTGKLFGFMNDTLRSEAFRSLHMFDEERVIKLLESLNSCSVGERQAMDSVVTTLASLALLGKAFKIA